MGGGVVSLMRPNKPPRKVTSKYLDVLEAIEDIVGDDSCEMWSMMAAEAELVSPANEMQAKIAAVYMLAHGNNPNHSCYHVHEGWRLERKAVAS